MWRTSNLSSKTWFTTSIVVLLIAFFALGELAGYRESSHGSQAIAKINGDPITKAEWNRLYNELRHEGASQEILESHKPQLFNKLILKKVLSQHAIRQGHCLHESEIKRALSNVSEFEEGGHFSEALFRKTLKSWAYPEKLFLKDFKNDLLYNQIDDGFTRSAFVLPFELEEAVAFAAQKRNFGYFKIDPEQFRSNKLMSEGELLHYYQVHQDDFTAPERVCVDYIELNLEQATPEILTDATLQQFYETYRTEYTEPSNWRIAQIVLKSSSAKAHLPQLIERLKKGEDFTALIVQHSESPATELWLDRTADSNLLAKLMTLKVNDVTEPIQTDQGLCIVKLLETQTRILPFTEVREQVAKDMARQSAINHFRTMCARLASWGGRDVPLEEAAKDLNLPLHTSGFFSRHGQEEASGCSPQIISAAFSDRVLKGKNSGLITLSPARVLILRIKQHKPAGKMSFEEAKNHIPHYIALQKARALGTQLAQKLESGGKASQLAKKHRLEWNVHKVTRFDKKAPAAILEAVFEMPAPQTGPIVTSSDLSDGTVGVILLASAELGVFKELPQEAQDACYKAIIVSQIQREFSAYAQNLLDQAQVDFNLHV